MDKFITKTGPSGRKALVENTPTIVNKKRASDDAIDPENVKKAKKTIPKAEFDLSSAIRPSFMKTIILPDEDELGMTMYEDCNIIRRKIRALLVTGVKVTHFLKWIDVNSNTYGRFMSYKKPYQGCDSSLYSAAYNNHAGSSNGRYIFFEKKRIAEGKPKSAARLQLERAGGWIATRVYTYEIQGQEEECFEDGKGRLFYRRTGKAVKLI